MGEKVVKLEIEYTYSDGASESKKVTETKELNKEGLLASLKELSSKRGRGGKDKAEAEAIARAINAKMNDLYELYGKPAVQKEPESLEEVESVSCGSGQLPKTDKSEGSDSTPFLPEGFMRKTKDLAGTEGLYTVDRYNNYSWRNFEVPANKLKKFEDKGEVKVDIKPNYFSVFNPAYNVTNAKADIESDLKNWMEGKLADSDEKKSIADYQTELFKSRYSPVVTYLESEDFTNTKESKTEEKKSFFSVEVMTRAKRLFELQTRRACKFGLDYAQQKNYDVAFMRDVENEDSVIAKKEIEAIHRVPITTSELRKQFRIEKRGSSVKKARFFSINGNDDSSPWDDTAKASAWSQIEKDNLIFYKVLYKYASSGENTQSNNGADIEKSEKVADVKTAFLEKYKAKEENKDCSNSELVWRACCGYLKKERKSSPKTSDMKREIVENIKSNEEKKRNAEPNP